MTTTMLKPIALPSSGPPKPLTALDISTSSSMSTSPGSSPSKPFQRLRSTLEQTLRTATRSRRATPRDDVTIASTHSNTGKENVKQPSEDAPKEKGKGKALQHRPSRTVLRQEAAMQLPVLPTQDKDEKRRVAGFTSYQTPSLRQGSVSSPALHLSSQAQPSPRSRPAIPALSSPSNAGPASPQRERPSRSSSRREISPPLKLGSRREKVDNPDVFSGNTSRHRPTKSTPPVVLTSPSAPSLPSKPTASGRLRDRVPPSRLERELPSPPETPPPTSVAPSRVVRRSSKAAASSGDLSSASPPSPEPSTPTRGLSPNRAQSPTTRPRVVSPSKLSLPNSPLPPSRKPYIEPLRTSLDAPRLMMESPTGPPGDSPSPAPRRAASPMQQSYAQNRHFKITGSPEHRELIRHATSMLCREMTRPPPHMSKTESGMRDWKEVERRISTLKRAERMWGKSGAIGLGNPGEGFLNPAGEDRERRLFADALKDGFIMCQLINRLRSSSVVRPDPQEDGIFRSSNVTKFLAACASHGLPSEVLFQPDDLTAVTSEPLARVAKTVIALINFVDSPLPSGTISGEGKKQGSVPIPIPYKGSASRASASTPNLLHISPSSSPIRKRWSPPSALPPVRSNSSEEDSTEDDTPRITLHSRPGEIGGQELLYAKAGSPPVPLLMPPPRSAFRPRPTKRADSSAASASPTAADFTHAYDIPTVRQSVVSTAMTDTTVATVVSSILDNTGRSWSGQNKYGTIRTVTTDLTSEAPSLSRSEGSNIAEDMARKWSLEGSKFRDRKLSETPPADLDRVVEETDESLLVRGGRDKIGSGRAEAKPVQKPQKPEKPERSFAVNLHKGRWPDDFMVFGNANPALNETQRLLLELDEEVLYSAPLPARSQRDLSGSPHKNEIPSDLPNAPRRPHRHSHSVDNPMLVSREGTMLRRERSPDGAAHPRVMLRRHSTKPACHRSAVYSPSSSLEDPRNRCNDTAVPFPRTTSRERPSGCATPIAEAPSNNERPKPLRGRFQSDVEETRRRMYPNADEFYGRPRSRIESMVSLGVTSNASASDLWRRESMGGSRVRKTIVVKENGKPAVQYQLGNCIGRGQFGSVYRALNLSTGQTVAVKQIRLEGLKEEEVTELMKEVNIYKCLSHPSIVRYEGMTRDEETLSIVLEYAENGSLGQTLKAFGKLNERLVASYVAKILEGLHYLHCQDVVHCDLKAANILTTKTGNVKLTDFGVSLNLRAVGCEFKNVAGTPNWMAPEIIELKGASVKSDIWSLACTIIELLTGRPPYADISNSMTVMFRIVEDEMPPIPEECSDLARAFLVQCFNKDPAKRPSAELLFEHPWLKQNWGIHKELRPQDSIPFLRRVSADLQKSEVTRYLAQIEMPSPPTPESATSPGRDSPNVQSPLEQRFSASSVLALGENDFSPREHTFVQTKFGKPMYCRVCLKDVKKSAVICSQCSLVSHSKCAPNAPPTCDLRAQLLKLAQYAAKGSPTSQYHNPADALDSRPPGPMSDVPYVTHSEPSQPANQIGPSTALRLISSVFNRSRSNLADPASSTASSPQPQATSGEDKVVKRKMPFCSRNKERPLSITSNSTGVSSTRSAATAAESFTSGRDTRGSHLSRISMDRTVQRYGDPRRKMPHGKSSSMADTAEGNGVPGALPPDKKRDSKTNGNCIVQ